MNTVDPIIREKAQKIITDQEFANLLRDMAKQNLAYTESKPVDMIPFELNVFSRSNFGEKFTLTVVLLDSLPELGSEFNRFKLMQAIGIKYCQDMVEKNPPGKRHFPIATFMNSEAWGRMEKATPEDVEEYRTNGIIDFSKFPTHRRQEVVIIGGMTIDKRVNQAILSINRSKDNKIILSEPIYSDYKEGAVIENYLLANFYMGFSRALAIQARKEVNQS